MRKPESTPIRPDPQQLRLLPRLFELATKVSDLPNGLRLEFPRRPGLLSEVGGIIEEDQAAGSTLCYALTVEHAGACTVLEITGPLGTLATLKSLAEGNAEQISE